MSSDNKFEDPYNISSEEAVGSLEVENTDTIQAESPVGAEKPVEAKKGPRGRRRWWNVRGERVCRRSAGGDGMFEVNVSAGGGGMFESARSAGGRLEVYQVREH